MYKYYLAFSCHSLCISSIPIALPCWLSLFIDCRPKATKKIKNKNKNSGTGIHRAEVCSVLAPFVFPVLLHILALLPTPTFITKENIAFSDLQALSPKPHLRSFGWSYFLNRLEFIYKIVLLSSFPVLCRAILLMVRKLSSTRRSFAPIVQQFCEQAVGLSQRHLICASPILSIIYKSRV